MRIEKPQQARSKCAAQYCAIQRNFHSKSGLRFFRFATPRIGKTIIVAANIEPALASTHPWNKQTHTNYPLQVALLDILLWLRHYS